jgi:chemotaxis protein methyltransferase CheR
METSQNLENLEIKLLLEAIYQRFGDDFRNYQRDLIRDKLRGFMDAHAIASVSALQDRILHEAGYFDALLRVLDARPAELFDHPRQMLALRKILVPWLRSCPAPQVWISGCTLAEDVYAIPILLMEENLYHRTRIFVTGANASLLDEAVQGRVAPERLAQYQDNYLRAGGKGSLAQYYKKNKGMAVLRAELRTNITWAQYNVGTDASFNEFELVVCRGGLKDYASALRQRVLQLFYDSMPRFGLLSLVDADYSALMPFIANYQAVSPKLGFYRK